MKKELLLLVLVLIICVCMFEAYIRIIHWPVPLKNQYPIGMTEFNSERGYSLSPNFTGSFPYDKSIKININSKGLRDYEHEYTKKNGTLRIMILGPSIVFGPGLSYDEIFTALLEKRLNETRNVEVIKAGFGGYSWDQEKKYYYAEGYKYNPDILIVATVLHDLGTPQIEQIKKNFETYGTDLEQDSKFRVFIKKVCHSCVFAYSTVLKKDDTVYDSFYAKWENATLVSKYADDIAILDKNLKEKNTTMILLMFPNTWQFENYTGTYKKGKLPQQVVSKIAMENNIAFIDISQYLDTPNYLEYYVFNDDAHYNKKGNELLSEILYNDLLKSKQLTIQLEEKNQSSVSNAKISIRPPL